MTLGGAAFCGATNAQCGLYSAPCSIHARSVSICSADSTLFVTSGGIRTAVFACVTRKIS